MTTERDASVDRVIAFSDGVVAIAITLLILPLSEIEPGEGATLGNVAIDNSGALFAFALSFAVIANYWTIHKDIFRPLRRTTRASCYSTCCGLPPSSSSPFLLR
jgi:uncharacterized membrane protein